MTKRNTSNSARSRKAWEARKKMQKTRAAQVVDRKSRDDAVQTNPTNKPNK